MLRNCLPTYLPERYKKYTNCVFTLFIVYLFSNIQNNTLTEEQTYFEEFKIIVMAYL